MPQVPLWRDPIADSLFNLLHFGETALAGPRPDDRFVHANLKHPARPRNESDFSEFALKRGQELLRHPRSAQQPPALRAVFYFHARMFRRHALQFSAGPAVRENRRGTRECSGLSPDCSEPARL
jgi:hypothetical protein